MRSSLADLVRCRLRIAVLVAVSLLAQTIDPAQAPLAAVHQRVLRSLGLRSLHQWASCQQDSWWLAKALRSAVRQQVLRSHGLRSPHQQNSCSECPSLPPTNRAEDPEEGRRPARSQRN